MNLEFLHKYGFQEIDNTKIEMVMLLFSGFDIETSILSPNKYTENIQITLSKLYGLGSFPYHTDGSHKKLPPRYIILEYMGNINSKCSTLLFDTNEIKNDSKFEDFLYNEIYSIKGGKQSFLSPIINKQLYSAHLLRWNELTMKKQIDKTGISFCEFNKIFHHKIKWNVGKILIIDNWRLLHSRESVPISEKDTRIFNRYNLTPNYGSIQLG